MALRIAIDVRHIRDFGIGTYIRNLVRSLAELDKENVYLLAANEGETAEFADIAPNVEVLTYHPPKWKVLEDITFSWFLRSLHADLVHIPLNEVPFFVQRPYVVTIHDMSSFLFGRKGGGVIENLRLHAFRRGLVRATRVIAVSAATRRDVANLLGIAQSRIEMVYSAPDPRFTKATVPPTARTAGEGAWAKERMRVLERYQIHYPYILYAGRIRPHKNLPRLIEAFAVLRGQLEKDPRFNELRLLIIGDEISKHPQVRRAVAETRMQPYVRFLGFIPFDTLKIFYSAAAAFAFPSLYEGFGLPPLEAMASGTPVVTSAVSSLPEVVADAAMIVNPENVFDIARGLREVLTDERTRRTLVQAGYTQIRQFNWLRTAEQTLAVYRTVCRENKKR